MVLKQSHDKTDNASKENKKETSRVAVGSEKTHKTKLLKLINLIFPINHVESG